MLAPMSVSLIVALGLLGACALVAATLAFGYPVGEVTSLWHEVSEEERVRYGLVPSTWWRWVGGGVFTVWMVGSLVTDLRHTQVSGEVPGYAFFHSGVALCVPLFYFVGETIFRIRWSWRVRRLPEGVCSAPLRRLARWTFPLNIAVCGCLLAGMAAVEFFIYSKV